jgi:hypothetical protein
MKLNTMKNIYLNFTIKKNEYKKENIRHTV